MYEYYTSDELYHYGRKGMKWGQHIYGKVKAAKTAKRRKAALVKARATKAANKEAAEKRARDIEKGKISAKKMTDKEIQDRMARLKLEKDYQTLLNEVKTSKNNRGKRFVDKFMDSSVDKLAEGVAADVVAQAVKHMLVKGVNNYVFADEKDNVVFTNNKRK